MIKCGIYEIDITPSIGEELPGGFVPNRSVGILENLCISAAYFESDGNKVVLLSGDMLSIQKEEAEIARNEIAEKLGMSSSSVLFCVTHVHSGGPIETWGYLYYKNPDYVSFVLKRAVDAAVLAAQDAREVKLRFGIGKENTMAFYRDFVLADGRYMTNCSLDVDKKPFGEIDPDVSVLRIDNADGTNYGVIANFACHCDCVGGDKVSTDYPGIFRETMRKIYGSDFKPMFINGFCGNINHCDFFNYTHKKDKPHHKSMGRRLAGVVTHTMEVSDYMECTKIAGVTKELTIPTRVPSLESVEQAKKALENKDIGIVDKFYADEAIAMYEVGEKTETIVIQVLRIGDMFIYCLPAEIYVEFGFMLKERSKGKFNITANTANGYLGYIPIKELFKEGIYEARTCCSSKMCEDAGYIMVDELLKLAEEIY